MQNLVLHFRKAEALRHHSILPGDVLLFNGRVMVPVTFLHNLIIDRMVKKFDA